MKKHNFSAGPSILPRTVIEQTAQAILDFDGIGLSIAEISHRGKEFEPVIEEAQQLFKELLDIPAGYEVLFLGGGASMQFCMVPFNLMNNKSAYLDTGTWASKAIKEAKLMGECDVVASSKDKNYNYIPKGYNMPSDADYFHFTSNNTIYGTEIKTDPDHDIPVVCDMSSDIFSRPVDVSKYAIIYGGAQKNLAPSGVTFVIVKEDALGKVERKIPTMLDYRTHISKGSMFNTPPVIPIYSAMQTLRWIKENGGVAAMQKRNNEKADTLYNYLDGSKMFRPTVTDAEDRSIMNVCYVMKDEYKELEKDFLQHATENGMVGIKGHRSVGGFRASIYNAMGIESIHALIELMKAYENKKA